MKEFEPVIGLEIHAQIKTRSKMFSPDPAHFEKKSNSHIHPVSLGWPGVLPVFNEEVLKKALKAGRAFHCEIQEKSFFARKHYFYPDLPKGYQISQFQRPLLKGGFVEFYAKGVQRKIPLERIHIEEDAGRLIHLKEHSLVDFNRAGQALMEIVSHPQIESPDEAAQFSRMVRMILLSLDICDGNMQEGSLRFDCNISLRPREKPSREKKLGTKVEIKNLNSFRFMERALNFEIKRQTNLLEKGKIVSQETRLFNPKKNETFPMRTKEGSSDYRYFSEPDLPPLIIEEVIKKAVKEEQAGASPELPFERITHLKKEGLPLETALILVESPPLYDYFLEALRHTKEKATLAKWITNDLLGLMKEKNLSLNNIPVPPEDLAHIMNLIHDKTLSSKMAKDLLVKINETKKSAAELIKSLNLKKLNEEDLAAMVGQVIQEFPKQWEQYRGGREKVEKFLMGQLMRISKGQADPEKALKFFKDKLKN